MKKLQFFLFTALSVLFFTCSKTSTLEHNEDAIYISGSDTELQLVNDLSSAFAQTHSGSKIIHVSGGGSSIGIEQLINGDVQIANSSRPITSEERNKLKELGIDYKEIVLAVDAITIITDPQVGVDSLSTVDLSNIFTGRVKNWKQLGGKDLPILIMGRDEFSGTRHYLMNRFARYEGFGSNHKEIASNEEIINQVENTKGSIGYVGIGYIMNSIGTPIESVWTMPIYVEGGNTHSPYEMLSVSQGQYELTRPLYQYVSSSVRESISFIDFEQSKAGKSIILKSGFYLSMD